MHAAEKIIPPHQLASWRHQKASEGLRIVATNGCFDLIHAGHVTYLEAAKQHGDLLLVGLNSDASVRQLKGPSRPLNHETDRALVLAALQTVDAVSIFSSLRATEFLQTAQPDVYVKGGDYTLDSLDPEERKALEACGAKIVFIPYLPGRSTTTLLNKMNSSSH